jgi:hypothetical protein
VYEAKRRMPFGIQGEDNTVAVQFLEDVRNGQEIDFLNLPCAGVGSG